MIQPDRNDPPRGPPALLALGLAGVFLLIGAVFIAAPPLGATLFGIPADNDQARAYLRALALRDLALGLYLGGLLRFGSRRGLGVVLVATVVIPLGDLLLVLSWQGPVSPLHLLLHAGSAAVTGGTGVWLLCDGPPPR
ncbi:DUF4267 domain-containing protein [Pseudoroseomonas globiformis]|uniref:DUF4267 domain-containing protein n=1 Tax=Teichococcus globiformis TaxID=2307229 RepID=A0ABV7FV65_9PROT